MGLCNMSSSPRDLTAARLLQDAGVPEAARLSEFPDAPGTRVVFGCGMVEKAGIYARTLGGERVMVVTDRGIAEAGHLDRVVQSLSDAGVEWSAFLDVEENPTTDTVAACVEAARKDDVSLFFGLGGGSSMDTAKGCNFILTNGGEMKDYWGHDKAHSPMLPLIAIPTTAGTGSECQSYALISDAKTHAKMACGDRKAAARIAILDPELTLTQPRRVTALTGIDALAHAVESAVCRKATDVSRAYSRAAFVLLARAFPRVLADASDLEARAMMLLGAALAGTAIENSMLGAAHSAANPLTAHYGIVHGAAVGLMLPHVVSLNQSVPAAAEEYAHLSRIAALTGPLTTHLSDLALLAGIAPLHSSGMTAEAIPQLAVEAAKQWTAQFNPAVADEPVFHALYAAALA